LGLIVYHVIKSDLRPRITEKIFWATKISPLPLMLPRWGEGEGVTAYERYRPRARSCQADPLYLQRFRGYDRLKFLISTHIMGSIRLCPEPTRNGVEYRKTPPQTEMM